MSGQQLVLMLVALALAITAASLTWQSIRRRRRIGVVDEFLRDVAAARAQLRSAGPGNPVVARTRAQDDVLDGAGQLLHARRHRAGTASSCGRCRADVEALANAFGWPA